MAILSFDAHLDESSEAVKMLEANGLSVTLADAWFAEPLDRVLLHRLARNHRALITGEQGSRGGFGALVLHDLADEGLLDGQRPFGR